MYILYRIIIIILVLAASYSLFGIGHFKWMYHNANSPKAEFLIAGNTDANITLVEFMNYKCPHCKKINPVIKELLEIRKDIRYIVRPVAFIVDTEQSDAQDNEEKKLTAPLAENITRIAFAAGLQNKFWEMHHAFLEYPNINISDEFIKETAELYGIDYDLMITDSKSEKVRDLVENNLIALDHIGLGSVPSFIIKNEIYLVTDEEIPTVKQFLDVINKAEKS